MEYEKEDLLGIESLAIKELKSKKILLDRSNTLFNELIQLGNSVNVKAMVLAFLGMFMCGSYLLMNENFLTISGMIVSVLFLVVGLFPFGVFVATAKITDSQSWTYRYIKKPKSLIEMNTSRQEWNHALNEFSPILQEEKVQFEILKSLNSKREILGINQKSQYENLLSWLTYYLKNKEYNKGLETLLKLYELLESDSPKEDYYQELKEKFTRPAYESQL